MDFVAEQAILLHLKPLPAGGFLVVNDRTSDRWGREVRLPIEAASSQDHVDVELAHGPDGVEIRLAGGASTVFTRCGDLHRATAVRVPATVEQLPDRAPAAAPPVPSTPQIERVSAPPSVEAPAPGTSQAALDPPATASPAALAAAVRAAAAARNWKQVVALAEGKAEALREDRAAGIALARGLTQVGRAAEAEVILRCLGPDGLPGEDVAFHLGIALQKQQRHEEARQLFLRCLAQRPDEARYVFEAGRTTAQCVNGGFGASAPQPALIDEAIALLTRATGLMARDGRPHRELAGLLQQKGRFEEALAALVEAQRRSPALVTLPLERARLLVRLDRIEEALAEARAALKAAPDSDAAGFTVRTLERWLDARREGPLSLGVLTAPRPG